MIYAFTNRYEFMIHDKYEIVAVGDKWTGCVVFTVDDEQDPVIAKSCDPIDK